MPHKHLFVAAAFLVSSVGLASVADAPPTLAASTVAADPGPINTGDRAAVINAFYDSWLTNERVPVRWTGNAASCTVGAVNPEAQQATEDQVNFFRRMSGLDPVSFDPGMNAQAQAAAMLMEANNDLSHYPPSSWACWSQYAADGAGTSNLALGNTGASAITAYMVDSGENNLPAGHRRWLQTPGIRWMGSGSTHSANALKMGGGPAAPLNPTATTPDWVAWPTPGYFPAPLEPEGRWSWFPLSRQDATATTTIDVSKATVSMSGPSGTIPVTLNPGGSLVWQVPTRALPTPDPGAEVSITVTISGLTQVVRTASSPTSIATPLSPITYGVILVGPDRPLQVLTRPTLNPVLPMVGQKLSLPSTDLGSYLNTDDVDLDEVAWVRDGQVVSAATTRRLTAADAGHLIAARLTLRDYDRYYAATTVETDGVRAFTAPAVQGVARVGAMLTVRRTWPSHVTARVQWTRDGRPIRGARTASYRPQPADRGHRLGATYTLRARGFRSLTSRTAVVRVR